MKALQSSHILYKFADFLDEDREELAHMEIVLDLQL